MNNKKLFLEIQNHLLNDNKPSTFLNQLKNKDIFKNSLFNIFNELNEKSESNDYNSWNHTLKVVDIASKYKHLSNNITAFMWAAFFHDIGKVRTLNPIHDRIGGEITRRILRECSEDGLLNEYIIALVKHHSAPTFVLNRISYSIIDLINTTDIYDVALLSLCNKISELPSKENNIDRILLDSNNFLQVMSSKTCVTFKNIVI